MRNKGLGTVILKFAERRTLELGYNSIRAFIEEDNEALIRLVEKLGFIRTGRSGTQYGYAKALSRKA
jgi:RimJ/RimL family protein N-acetyltransferase